MKSRFHLHKKYKFDRDVDIDKMLISNKISFGEKRFQYFIGYKDSGKGKVSFIILPKMHGYVNSFDETKYISFFDKR